MRVTGKKRSVFAGEALKSLKAQAFKEWYAFRINLAICLREIGTAEAIDEAISISHAILPRIVAEKIPDKHPVVNMFLGDLYREQHNGVRTENLKATITHYETTLKLMTSKEDCLVWASVAVGLGKAYLDLGKLLGSLPDEAKFVKLPLKTAIHMFKRHGCDEEREEASWVLKMLNNAVKKA